MRIIDIFKNVLILISSSFLVISCDNTANTSLIGSTSDSVKSVTQADTINFLSSDSIPVVFLDADTILKMNTNVSKLVYQFYIPESNPLAISLDMYSLTGNRYNAPISLKISSRFVKFNFSNKKIVFGDQMLGRQKLERLKRELEKDSNLVYIVFIPQQDPVSNHIYYRIYLFTQAQFESWQNMPLIISLKDVEINAIFFDDTNPSPPATP